MKKTTIRFSKLLANKQIKKGNVLWQILKKSLSIIQMN